MERQDERPGEAIPEQEETAPAAEYEAGGEMPPEPDDGFAELAEMVPDIRRRDDIPPEAAAIAGRMGISLYDGYLRHRHEEERRARQAAEEAARRSAGPQACGGGAAPGPADEAFREAFRGAVW